MRPAESAESSYLYRKVKSNLMMALTVRRHRHHAAAAVFGAGLPGQQGVCQPQPGLLHASAQAGRASRAAGWLTQSWAPSS